MNSPLEVPLKSYCSAAASLSSRSLLTLLPVASASPQVPSHDESAAAVPNGREKEVTAAPEQCPLCSTGVAQPSRADPILHVLISSAQALGIRFERTLPNAPSSGINHMAAPVGQWETLLLLHQTSQVTQPCHTGHRGPYCLPCCQAPAQHGRVLLALPEHSDGRVVRGWKGEFKFDICV